VSGRKNASQAPPREVDVRAVTHGTDTQVRREYFQQQHEKAQEAEMAQIIAVVSLGFLLTATALVWRSWEPGTGVNAGASTTSLSISDIGRNADAQSLPVQEIEDNTTIYSGAQDQ
jgi:hypothetical protein